MQYINKRLFGEFFLLLEKNDKEIAEVEHAKPCLHCQGRLDVANFFRKPRGPYIDGPVLRFSLCCREEGCRKRLTPESLRFLERLFMCRFSLC